MALTVVLVAAPILGHVGDGNFHVLIMYDPADRDQLNRAQELADRMAKCGYQYMYRTI